MFGGGRIIFWSDSCSPDVASVGAFLFGFSQILFLFIVLKTVMGGKKATGQVWEGAKGLEWTVASPAPYHTFSTPPKID